MGFILYVTAGQDLGHNNKLASAAAAGSDGLP